MKRNKEMKQFYMPKCNILRIPKDKPESEEYGFSNDQDVQVIVYIQNRKHRKKRINKKWFKRYGYIQKNKITKGWKLRCNTNGTTEFVNDNYEEVNI